MMSVLIASIALNLQPAAAAELRELRGSTLYAVDPRTEQRYPTVRVPHRPGAICWHWVVHTAAEDREIRVREVVELPARPRSWREARARGARISADGRSAETSFSDSIADSQVGRRWCVNRGDPLGPYRVRVFLGERELADIRFEMVAGTE